MVITAVFLLAFFVLWVPPSPRVRMLSALGVGCWLMVPVMEFVESQMGRLFGDAGLPLQQFVEESLEITGATLLVVGVMENLLVAHRREAVATGREGRRLILFGSAAPALLIPFAVVAWGLNADFREQMGNVGYGFAGARTMLVMDNLDRWGHHLVVSDGCDLAGFQKVFLHQVQEAGLLSEYPPPGMRLPSPDLTLSVLRLRGDESPETIAAGLARVSMLSSHLWHLQCDASGEADRNVDVWLSERYVDAERLWLPGIPPVTLTRATPSFPLPDSGVDYEADYSFPFDEGQVVLTGHHLSLEQVGDSHVVRLLLSWVVQSRLAADYHVFVHLVDEAGTLVSQSDGVPDYDRYPFDEWAPGQTVVDSYDVPVPDGQSMASYELRVGIYDYDTGERLPVGELDYVPFVLPDGKTP
jgi:hypothetical protein